MRCSECGHENSENADCCIVCETAFKKGFYEPIEIELTEGKCSTEFASIIQRFCAGFIDYILVAISTTIVKGILRTFGIASMDGKGYFWRLMVFFAIFWIYSTIEESSPRRATVGKRMLRISVVDINRKKVSYLRAGIRNLLKVVCIFVPYIKYISFPMAAFMKKKQALYDLLSSCYVIRK